MSTPETRYALARTEAEAAFARWQTATTDAELREGQRSTQLWVQILKQLQREQAPAEVRS